MIMNPELVKFAADSQTGFYDAAMRYFCDNEKTADNKDLMHKAFLAEVEHKSHFAREGLEVNAWIGNPSVSWAAMSIVDSTIRAIIPVTILPQFNLFADFRTQGFGDITKFTIQPRSFYVVSKGGRAERTSFRQRKFNSDVTLTPEEHIITIFEKMYNVLSGRVNIADFMAWVMLSVQTEMYTDALIALNGGLATIPNGALNVNGAFDMKTLVKMCETVQYRNGGVKPIIAGSATALMNVLPDSTSGYRMNVDGEGNGSIELLRNIMGYTVMKLDNAVTKAGELILPDDKIYVISPSQDKLLKGVMTTTLSNSNQFYDNADLTTNFSQRIEWGFMFATSAYCGIYTINQ